MTYNEALQIGTKADGAIRGTYARLYDENGNVLFSLQRADVQETFFSELQHSFMGDGESLLKEDEIVVSDGGIYYFEKGWINKLKELGTGVCLDLPIVVAETKSDGALVPVRLVEETRQLILSKIINKSYQSFIDILKNNDVVYVNPNAFDWNALNVKNYSDILKQAEDKMNVAKAAIMVAGAVTII